MQPRTGDIRLPDFTHHAQPPFVGRIHLRLFRADNMFRLELQSLYNLNIG